MFWEHISPISSCYYHSRSEKVSCLTGIPSGLSVRERAVMSAAPPLTPGDARVKATTRSARLLETNLVCLSPSSSLAEPLPGSAGRDYSAGGARDGAGKSLFIKAEGIGACCELSAAFITLHGFV